MSNNGGIDINSVGDMNGSELKELLRLRGLSTDGGKSALTSRLTEALESEQEPKKRKLGDEEEDGESVNKKQKLEGAITSEFFLTYS